jgi:hypothetical protein
MNVLVTTPAQDLDILGPVVARIAVHVMTLKSIHRTAHRA